MANEVKFTKDEKAIVQLALQQAIASCRRSIGKAALLLVKQAYQKQVEVLEEAAEKLENM